MQYCINNQLQLIKTPVMTFGDLFRLILTPHTENLVQNSGLFGFLN